MKIAGEINHGIVIGLLIAAGMSLLAWLALWLLGAPEPGRYAVTWTAPLSVAAAFGLSVWLLRRKADRRA